MRDVRLSAGLVATAALAWASAAQATETRYRTLEEIGGVQDEVQSFSFPARVARYRLALVELGTAGNEDVYGAAFVGKAQMSGGVALSRSDWILSEPMLGSAVSLFDRYEAALTSEADGGPFLPAPERPVELLGALRLGGERSVGLRLAGASLKEKDASGEGAALRSTKLLAEQVDLGLGYTGPAGKGVVDVGLTTHLIARQTRSERALGVDSSTSVKGKRGAVVEARWLQSEEASGAYANAAWVSRKYSAATKTAAVSEGSSFDESVLLLEGGYALLQKEHDAHLFAGLAGAKTSSKGPTVSGAGGKASPSYLVRDDKAKIEATVLSAALAGEAKVGGGWGTMLGLRYALWGTIKETDKTSGVPQKTETSVAETPDASLWSLGLYYEMEALRVDASYSKAFLHNGPYLVAGNATSPLFGRLSASYAF